MKRFLAWCLAAAMILTMLPSLAFAAAVPTSGKLEGTLAAKGSWKEGETLSADFEKVKPEGVKSDQLNYEWFRVDKKGKSKSISKEATYKLQTEDIDQYIQLTITAKEGESVTGSLTTAKMGPIVDKNSVPVNVTPTPTPGGSTPSATPAPGGSAAVTPTPTPGAVFGSGNETVNVGTPTPSVEESPSAATPTPTPYEREDNRTSSTVTTPSPTPIPTRESSDDGRDEEEQVTFGQPTATPAPNTSSGTSEGTNHPITVQEEKVTITTDSLPGGKVGEKYQAVFAASGQVQSWKIMNKVMPEGLSFNESTGELSGTPEGAFDGMLRVIAVLPDGENVEKDISLKIAEKETSGSESTAVSDEPEKTEPSEEVKDPSEETKDPSEETKDPEEKPEEEVPVEKVPSLSPYDERVNFGSLYEGYEEENFELTLFNTGNADAEDLKTEIKGDLADQVAVGELSKIESGGNVTILLSLQPGLKAGKYSSKLIITGADDVRLELPMEVEIQDRNYTISLSQKSLDFGSCSEGYSESGSAKVAVTNTSIFPVTVEKPVSDHFYVSGPDSKTISAGGSESYTVRPVTGLKKGTYEETLVFQSKEGAKASLKVKVEIKEKDEYSFDVYWQNGSGNFGYAPLGYNDENGYAPHSRNLVIRNTGNQTLEFKQPVSHSGNKTVYDITQLDEPTRKAVKPGETITVAIRPVLGLSPDVYDEDIVIDAVNDGRDPVIGAHVTFTVVNESIYRGVDLDQGTVVRENGVSKTAKGLGLPSTVKARTTAGTIDVDVVWNVDSCDYNPALKEEQNFTVWGRIDLPSNVVNYYDYSTMTSIGVRVLAYDPKLANPAENRIYGIAQGDVFQAGKTISFSAEGSGMNRKSAPSRGDIRYEPTYWKVADTNAKWSTEGSWSKSPYSASFAIGSSGSYKLRVTFTKEEYDGSQWVSRANDSDGQDVKSVAFKIKGTASVSSAKSDTVTKVKQAVKTGDETELLPMVLLAAAGILVISGTGIMLRNRRKK